MKVGVKKIHENEWLVHVGFANIHLDRFSLELLAITLGHVRALEHGKAHSIVDSYVQLGLRLKQLDNKDLQQLVRQVENRDLLALMVLARDDALNDRVLRNVGNMVAKQLKQDLQKTRDIDEQTGKDAVKRVVETMFEMETQGQIEFYDEATQYI